MINLKFKTEKNGISKSSCNEVYTLLQINSDIKKSATKRSPLNIAVALDRSGSMSGQPLEEAKRCIEIIIDSLTNDDYFSLITYDNMVDIPIPSNRVSNKEWMKSIVRNTHSGGCTALYDGWSTAAAEAAKRVSKKSISRVLLLSDGQANDGVTDHITIASHCAEMASVGVSTTTYGLGEDFNEELMTSMAKSGKGLAHYGQTADDLADPFQSEFDLIKSITARDLNLHLIAEPGVNFEVLNHFHRNPDGSFIMSDLAEGGELWALLKINVPKSLLKRTDASSIRLLSAFLDYKKMDGTFERSDQVHLILDLISDHEYKSLPTEEMVSLRKVELHAANLQDAARIAARRSDWHEVKKLMLKLDELGLENEWVRQSTEKLREYAERRETERFSKEAFYKSNRMRTRMGAINESPSYSEFSEKMHVPSYLRRKLEIGKKISKDQRRLRD